MLKTNYAIFESTFQVRPDDIDMFQHVHNSKYFDYVLAARYDQMERCYGMPMEKFLSMGFGWVVNTAFVQYKRALCLGDWFVVRTTILEIGGTDVKVGFEIISQKTKKITCDGWFNYSMINLESKRSEKIPEWIIEKYSV